MTVVDTHCHTGLSWFEPVESLLFQMETNGVDKAAIIQHRGAYDNSYVFECMRRNPGKFAAVVQVDVSRPDAPTALEKLAGQGASGVRLMPTTRSPGADPLAIWRKASDLGLVVSCIGKVDEFAADEFAALVAEVSDLTIIVEHLAGIRYTGRPPYTTYSTALALAKRPNTYIKVGGLGEFVERPEALKPEFGFDTVPPMIEMAYDSFGPQRMMWGSDFPPVSHREGYTNSLVGVRDHRAFKSDEDREWVMGKTALSVFKFD